MVDLKILKPAKIQKIPLQASPPSPLSRRVSWKWQGATESEGSGDLRAHSKPEEDPEDKVFERELNLKVVTQEHLVVIVGKSKTRRSLEGQASEVSLVPAKNHSVSQKSTVTSAEEGQEYSVA